MIHIYETDYNFLIGAVWREAIQHAQKLGKINQGQYGGCPGRDYTSVTYLEEIFRFSLGQPIQTLTMMLHDVMIGF